MVEMFTTIKCPTRYGTKLLVIPTKFTAMIVSVSGDEKKEYTIHLTVNHFRVQTEQGVNKMASDGLEEMMKQLEEGSAWEIPLYECPVCNEKIEGSFYGIYTHIAVHMGELLAKVDRLLEQ